MDETDPDPPLVAREETFAAGGGAFELPELTLGVFDVDQPTHRISVGGDRREHRPLAAGEGWIMPAAASGFCEYDAPLPATIVSLSDDLLAEIGLERADAIAPQVGAHDPLLLELVRAVARLGVGSPRLYRETMHRALASHLAQLLRPAPADGIRIDDRRLARAIDHIHAHLADDLSLETLAAEATLSPYHFARAFKRATGLSPLQFVIRERMRSAKVLLDTTRLTVVEIGYRVGYEDVSRFRKHFKREFGLTPAQSRTS